MPGTLSGRRPFEKQSKQIKAGICVDGRTMNRWKDHDGEFLQPLKRERPEFQPRHAREADKEQHDGRHVDLPSQGRCILFTKLLAEANGLRTFAVILETGEEAMASLRSFAEKEGLTAAHISAIGAFSEATISYFDWERKEYEKIPVREQVEVAALSGDVAIGPDSTPAVHIHVVLGKRGGGAVAGHLNDGLVRPTLEVILTEAPVHLHKRHDPSSGLALIRM